MNKFKGYFFKGNLCESFHYPLNYLDEVVSPSDIKPWWYVSSNTTYADLCFRVINKKLPTGHLLVPFAKCDQGDYVACFDGRVVEGDEPRIFTYKGEKSFSDTNIEERFSIASFNDWLAIVEDW